MNAFFRLVYTGSGKVDMADKEPREMVDYRTPLSAEVIIQLINSSIQSGKPLWLRRANLCGADLRWTNLSEANLTGADLRDTRMHKANLRQADLRGAKLSGANLSEANLSGNADLSEADLSGANLRETDLMDAFLCEADLSETNLSGANLRGAKYNAGTKWPEGFDPGTAGAVLLE